MTKRNIWTNEETTALLAIINEKECLRHFDGKKYRNSEIYKLIEKELKTKGYCNKTDKQIEVRWKNLKSSYIASKKANDKSGSDRKTCPYYEELNQMLGCRPSTTIINGGVDTFRDLCTGEVQIEDNSIAIQPIVSNSMSSNLGDEFSSSYSPPPTKKIKHTYSKNIEILVDKMKKVQKEANAEFLESQKELIKYEFDLHTRKEEEYEERFEKLINKTTSTFLNGINTIINIAKSDSKNQNLSQQTKAGAE